MTTSLHVRLTYTRLLTAALLAVLSPARVFLYAAETAPPWELQPYDVQLLTAVDPRAALPADTEVQIGQFLHDRAAAVVGGGWRLSVAPATGELRAALLGRIESVSADDLPRELLKGDKLVLLSVQVTDADIELHAREFDVRTSLWSTPVETRVTQRSALKRQAFDALLAAFAPLARIESVDKATAVVRLRAGSIARRDPDLPWLTPEMVFRPVLVDDSSAATPVEWTYLVPEKTETPLVTCRIETGLKPPVLPDYHPLRQRLALAVRPRSAPGRLRLVVGDTPARPQAGLDVYTSSSANAPQWIGRTDRHGRVTIPAGDGLLRTLQIKQGTELLVRLPWLPGIAAEASATVAADPARLAAERFLLETRDVLVDTAARRALLIERIRAQLDSDKTAEARKLGVELRALPTAARLLAALDEQEQHLWPKGKPESGQLVMPFSELRELITKHLPAQPIEDLDAELGGSE